MAGQQVLKRLPGIGARFAAGSGSTAGAAAPVMAAWAAYDVADGSNRRSNG